MVRNFLAQYNLFQSLRVTVMLHQLWRLASCPRSACVVTVTGPAPPSHIGTQTAPAGGARPDTDARTALIMAGPGRLFVHPRPP